MVREPQELGGDGVVDIAEFSLKVDAGEAIARLNALAEAANRATDALKAFSDAYRAIGEKPIVVNVAAPEAETGPRQGGRAPSHSFNREFSEKITLAISAAELKALVACDYKLPVRQYPRCKLWALGPAQVLPSGSALVAVVIEHL